MKRGFLFHLAGVSVVLCYSYLALVASILAASAVFNVPLDSRDQALVWFLVIVLLLKARRPVHVAIALPNETTQP